jgi:glutathione S-transferase
VLNWGNKLALDLGRWPNIKPYVARVAARPKVQETMRAEGLIG